MKLFGFSALNTQSSFRTTINRPLLDGPLAEPGFSEGTEVDVRDPNTTKKRRSLRPLIRMPVHGNNAPPPCPLPQAQSSALLASPRRPVDRPPADLEHHDLPRRRQRPQQFVEDLGREPKSPGETVPRHGRGGPGDERRQPLGGDGVLVAVRQPFAERLHAVYMRSAVGSGRLDGSFGTGR